MKGLGVQGVREKIEQAFRSVHNDQRTREDVQAHKELLRELADSHICTNAEVDVQPQYKAITSATLRSPHVTKDVLQRSNVQGTWEIEPPKEDATMLFAQALRYLEGK